VLGSLLVLIGTPSQELKSMDLFRGVEISVQGSINRYWEVHEAEIDAVAPTSTIPTLMSLSGGKNRNLLMRFGSLDLAVGADKQIVNGTLTLKLSDPEHGRLLRVSALKKYWLSPGVGSLNSNFNAPPKKGEVPFAPGVTWNAAGGDQAGWSTPGALGDRDREILDCKIEDNEKEIKISGLGALLEKWRLHEGQNFGILLEFAETCNIWSSTSPEVRPTLTVDYRTILPKKANTVLTHNGNEVTVESDAEIERIDLWKGAMQIGQPKNNSFYIGANSTSRDPRGRVVRAAVSYKDPQIQDSVFYLDPSGTWIKTDHDQARMWNRSAIDSTYFSFARMGIGKYVNPEKGGNEDIRKSLIPFPSQGGRETDTQMLKSLIAPVRSTTVPIFSQLARPIAGALTLTEADYLVNGKNAFPPVPMIKVTAPYGTPIGGVNVKFSMSGDNYQDAGRSDENGLVILPKIPEGFRGDLKLELAKDGEKDSIAVPVWHFSDAFARGNRQVAVIDVPTAMPTLPVLRETNLLAGKPAKDSAGSFPAQLVSLTDGSDVTIYKLDPKGWIEFDLGRDRLLAELLINGDLPSSIVVEVYGTGEKIEDAMPWIKQTNVASFFREYFGSKRDSSIHAFRGIPMGARYVRWTNTSGSTVAIRELALFAGKR
jgi:hypothetical protein